MKATLEIDDALMERLLEEAKRRQTTIPELVDAGLKHFLDECGDAPLSRDKSRRPLPKWRGKLLVDISNREELQRIWDEDKPPIPTRLSGGILVDISNREELQRIWDEDAGFRY